MRRAGTATSTRAMPGDYVRARRRIATPSGGGGFALQGLRQRRRRRQLEFSRASSAARFPAAARVSTSEFYFPPLALLPSSCTLPLAPPPARASGFLASGGYLIARAIHTEFKGANGEYGSCPTLELDTGARNFRESDPF